MTDSKLSRKEIVAGITALGLFFVVAIVAMEVFVAILSNFGVEAFNARVIFKGIYTFVVIGTAVYLMEMK